MALNKRGFIKILEVMFAITLLGTAIIYVYTAKAPEVVSLEDYVSIYQREILLELSTNRTLRQLVIDGNVDELEKYIDIPSDLNYSLSICEMDSATPGYCNMDPTLRQNLENSGVHEFYSDETIIAADYNDYAPKKVVLFIWQVF